jgi:tRNA (Thr-GGU) A37 N-methylase
MHTRRGAQLRPIGVIRSVLKTRGQAPMQGSEGTPVVDIKPVLAGWRDF